MKLIILITILFLSLNLYSIEPKEYVLKFKTYNQNSILKYEENYKIKKYFTQDNKVLLNLKQNGERLSNNKLADLRTYFLIKLNKKEYENIFDDENISIVYENIKNIPRPIAQDLAPVTSSWVDIQGYIHDFNTHAGLSAYYGWKFLGGAGKNVTVVDIEGGWTHDHEDLGIEEPFLYDNNGNNLSGTPFDGDSHDNNHGTSVLGEIASAQNNYGTTGIAYKSNMKVVNDYSKEYGYSTADAIIRAISVLEKGSIILLESQKDGPNYHYDEANPYSQFGLVPDEWLQAEFDAIKTATSNGFIIIEAGANGEQNLDTIDYNTCNGDINTFLGDKSGSKPCFDIETRDSGAIIVGAGNPPTGGYGEVRAKMYYTSYGKRVDVQAWGAGIYTTAYGDLFYPNNDDKQAYTAEFGGTSGASPMITGIVAQLQSRYKEKNSGECLNAKEIRDIIKNPNYSNPQRGNDLTEHVGPQPDIKLIFENYLGDYDLCAPSCGEWAECSQTGCIVKEGRCDKNETCSSSEYCNIYIHECVDPCNSLTCQDNSTCTRFNENSRAECVCDKNYLINDNNECEYVEPKKPIENSKGSDDSCSFSDNSKNSYFFIFLLLSVFLLRKKFGKLFI